MNENLMSTGDEDGTVKIWDKRKSPDGKHSVVMESKQFDEHVNDIFFDETVDEKTMVASSGEGEALLYWLVAVLNDTSETQVSKVKCTISRVDLL